MVSDGRDARGDASDSVVDGAFSCGALACSDDEYCSVSMDDVLQPDGAAPVASYHCVTLPVRCQSDLSCDCLIGTDSGIEVGVTCTITEGHPVVIYGGG